MQIFEASKTELSGTILDLGGNDFSHNISKYFNGTYSIQFADKFPKDEKTIKVDLEHDEDLSQKFDNVCLMNILEHIKNYKNVINFSNKTLNVNGRIIGSVPFLFKIHYSPNDYFRFTEQLLYEEFRDSGFEQIEIKKEVVGDKGKLLTENLEVSVCFYNDKPISIDLPNQVVCKIKTTDVALKGQTVSSSYKPAVLENGLSIQVPPFIEAEDSVLIDTRNLEYIKKI